MNENLIKIGVITAVGLIVVIVVYLISSKKPNSNPTEKPLTTREKLDRLCPISISEKRGDLVYINATNVATRDNYLFGACKDANTCDTTTLDPISENLLKEVPKCHCGCWILGSYSWNPSTNKWVK
jgi:hypothetical protein